MASRRPRPRALLRGLLISSLSFAVTIAAVEVLMRAFYEPRTITRVYHPFSHQMPRPGLVQTYAYGGDSEVTVRLNELGMRGPEASQIPEEAMVLVFLGGSTTENYHLVREDAFPGLIARQLSESLQRPVVVLNGGMSAAVSGTTLGRLQHQVLDLEPDWVVIMDGINDLLGGYHPAFHPDGRHLPRPATVSTRPKSYLVDWLRGHGFDDTVFRRIARGWPKQPKTDVSPALAAFERNLRSIAAIGREHGVRVMYLTQPTLYENATPEDEERFLLRNLLIRGGLALPPASDLAKGMRAFNDAVRRRQEDGSAEVYDLAKAMPRSWDLFVDECHFSAEGNRRIAELVAPALLTAISAETEQAAEPNGPGSPPSEDVTR